MTENTCEISQLNVLFSHFFELFDSRSDCLFQLIDMVEQRTSMMDFGLRLRDHKEIQGEQMYRIIENNSMLHFISSTR